jgi:hypothetical protein
MMPSNAAQSAAAMPPPKSCQPKPSTEEALKVVKVSVEGKIEGLIGWLKRGLYHKCVCPVTGEEFVVPEGRFEELKSAPTFGTDTVFYRSEPMPATTATPPKKAEDNKSAADIEKDAAQDATQQIHDRQPAHTKCEERVEP